MNTKPEVYREYKGYLIIELWRAFAVTDMARTTLEQCRTEQEAMEWIDKQGAK